ncbi:MAG: twin-arginine translocase TatA/TatE family subunit [Planctomycetaceae bacterium]
MLGHCIAFIGAPGPWEMMVVGIIALLLFGKRLPEVARSLGKGFVEFKRGIQGIEEQVHQTNYDADEAASRPVPEDEQEELTAPKFEPPKSAPTESASADASKSASS